MWVPEEGLFEAEETDARTESFFDGDVVELGAWVTERAQAHRALFDAEREEARKSSVNASTTRSRGKSVILDESGAS